jgi:hypothetical protein
METYYYEDADQQSAGPFTAEELVRLKAVNALSDDSMIIRSGTNRWITYGEAADQDSFPSVSASGPAERLNQRLNRMYERIDGLLDLLLAWPHVQPPKRREACRRHLRFLNNLGQAGLLMIGIAAALITTLVSLHFDLSQGVIAGSLLFPGTFVVMYLSQLFSEANLRLAFGAPIHLFSPLVPRLITLSACLLAVVLLIGGLVTLWNTFERTFLGGIGGLLGLLGVVAFFGHLAWISGHAAEVMQVSFVGKNEQSSADYVCNLTRFAGRLLLLLLPVSTCTGVIVLLAGGSVLLLQFGISSPLMLWRAVDEIGSLALLPVQQSLQILGVGALAFSSPLLMLGTPVLGHIVGHFAYLLLTLWAEIGHGFFRAVDSLQKISGRTPDTVFSTSTRP